MDGLSDRQRLAAKIAAGRNPALGTTSSANTAVSKLAPLSDLISAAPL